MEHIVENKPLIILFVTSLAAIWDLKTRTIPNWLTLSAFFLVLVIQGFMLSFLEFGQILQTLLFAIVFFLVLFYFKILGGGDVKLLLVIACSVTIFEFLEILFFIFLVGGGQAMLVVLNDLFIKKEPYTQKTIPYGLAIFGGYFLFWYF